MDPLTLENVLLQLREFLVIWISQILYYNRIYPDSTFDKKRYLDLTINESRVPPLTEFLSLFATQMLSVLVQKDGGGKVHEVIVVVYKESSLHVAKRYVVNFSQFVGLAKEISSLDFLVKKVPVHLAKLDIPDLNWNSLYTHLRSLMFFHVEELKRTQEAPNNDLFFKFLLNVDESVDLSSEQAQWVKLTTRSDARRTKHIALGEVELGFLCFDMHNEYIL